MTERSSSAPRRRLTLLVAAALCLSSTPQLAADGGRVGVSVQKSGYHQAGFRIGIGYHGHHRYHHGYYGYGSYRYRGHYYRPYSHYRHYYPYHHTYGDYGYPRYGSRFFGALDLNVKPKKTTQVYIDGNYVGTAGNFDGWPQHLWLEKDSYEVILYNPGYETVVRQVEIQPRVVLDIREVMRPGESKSVEELTRATQKPEDPKPQFRRYAPENPPMEQPGNRPKTAQPPDDRSRPGVLDARQEPARIRLTVEPGDASVYLDGRFLGLATEINERPDGMLIDPGQHVIEIVRPGFNNRQQSFSVDAGQDLQLKLKLKPAAAKAGISA